MGELPHDELRDVLRTAAAEHQPDRDAMVARIAQQRTGQPTRPAGRLAALRPVAAALAVLTVAVLGGLGAWASVRSVHRDTASPAAAPALSITAAAPSTAATPSPSVTSRPSPRTPSAAPSTRAATTVAIPSGSAPEEGFLWSDGSIAPESTATQGRSDITLKNLRTITAAEVTIRIARTDGLADAGAWSTMPAADYTVTVERDASALVYHFELNPGVRLIPGTYVFTAQYDHPAGDRNANDDAYLATASAGRSRARVYGTFAPAN